MSVRNQFQLLLGGMSTRRTGSGTPFANSAMREFLDRSRLVAALIFVVTVVAIVLISSAGMTTTHLTVLPGQLATMRVNANAAFSYPSKLKTAAAQEELLHRVPPVYRLDAEPLRRFDEAARDLLAKLAAYESTHPAKSRCLRSLRPMPSPLRLTLRGPTM